jgi:hypothetical protein
MEKTLTREAKVQLASSLRRRYQAASSRTKKQILREFVAVSGYHPKYAVHLLNAAELDAPGRRGRVRPKLYDDAAKQALIVLWEASDRICGKRLKPLLRILLPSLERHGHLKLDEAIRAKVLAMSAATIDRLLRVARQATRGRKRRRVVPEIRRRVRIRTFADWHEPPPGSMEMDLVAHCGDVNRGSYVHSLVLTDIASGWTECAPLIVRESTLLVETLDRIRLGLPFSLRALDVDNGGGVFERNDDPILPRERHRADALEALPEERSGLDRAEKRLCRTQVTRVSSLRGHCRRAGPCALVWGITTLRELLSTLIQAGRKTPARSAGNQALSPTRDAMRAVATGRNSKRAHQAQASGSGDRAGSTAAARGSACNAKPSGGSVGRGENRCTDPRTESRRVPGLTVERLASRRDPPNSPYGIKASLSATDPNCCS